MQRVTHKVKIVSACKTYRETLNCISEAEANKFAEQLKADGWTVKIVPVKAA